MSDDAQKVADILAAVKDHVPDLLRSIVDLFYSPEAGERMGRAVGAFYKEMVEAGIPANYALELAQGYMAPLRMLHSLVSDASSKRREG